MAEATRGYRYSRVLYEDSEEVDILLNFCYNTGRRVATATLDGYLIAKQFRHFLVINGHTTF